MTVDPAQHDLAELLREGGWRPLGKSEGSASAIIADIRNRYADELIEMIEERRRALPYPDLDQLTGDQIIRLIRKTKTEGT